MTLWKASMILKLFCSSYFHSGAVEKPNTKNRTHNVEFSCKCHMFWFSSIATISQTCTWRGHNWKTNGERNRKNKNNVMTRRRALSALSRGSPTQTATWHVCRQMSCRRTHCYVAWPALGSITMDWLKWTIVVLLFWTLNGTTASVQGYTFQTGDISFLSGVFFVCSIRFKQFCCLIFIDNGKLFFSPRRLKHFWHCQNL